MGRWPELRNVGTGSHIRMNSRRADDWLERPGPTGDDHRVRPRAAMDNHGHGAELKHKLQPRTVSLRSFVIRLLNPLDRRVLMPGTYRH